MNNTDHDITRRLAQNADQFHRLGGSELEIGQVLARAGEIRRGRRMRATIVMAACVLAIAVPTALVAVNRDAGNEPSPAPPGPTKIDRSPITLDGVKQGDEPHVGYATDGLWHNSGLGVDLGAGGKRVVEVAPFKGGYLVASQTDSGNLSARVVDETGAPVGPSWPTDGGFAVSEGGTVAAFVQPDGTPVAVQGQTSYELPKIPGGTGFEAVAVIGEDCSPPVAPAGGCAVWVVSKGEHPATWGVTSDHVGRSDLEIQSVASINMVGELAAGITEVKDDLSTCSDVVRIEDPKATRLWSTCDYRFDSFSSDGKHLLAKGSVGSGIGESQLAVLDAETGKVQLDLRTVDQAFIYSSVVWEDDSHVLAIVFEKGQWAILRIGLDGSREYAVPPVDGEDVDSPFALPTR
jgi:hypothetical protein